MSRVDLRQRLADELEAVRQRSLDLLSPLDDDALFRQHSPLMSPLVWDLAHVGNYEELWLLREVAGAAPIDAALDDVYDAFRHPRAGRPSLPLLGPVESRRYLVDVRGRALDALERAVLDGDGGGRALLAGGFVYGMVVQHEHQHDETMLATLQLMAGDGYRPLAPPPPAVVDPPPSGEVHVAAGPFVMGTDSEPFAYDNERPAHVVDLPAFRIDAGPVTNGRYLEFVLDGGYDRPELWEAEGSTWRVENDVRHPLFWVREGRDWTRDRFGFHEDLPLDEPVQHVSWYEADAFARWAGKRLPTEAEWEKAASWTPEGVKRRYPWGDEAPVAGDRRANLGGGLYRPAAVGAYPDGAGAYGCHQMIGDVWEWTASDFEPYPGFASFPYREYSEVFFGPDYKVLRGGSWATSPAAVRNTFRNWDYPIRRQIFSGFRCARSA